MNRSINPILPALILVIVVVSVWAQSGGGYDLEWNTFDGGGATFSTGGGYELGGTIGQSDAGPAMSGGGYELNGGFWPGVTTGVVAPGIVAAKSRRLHAGAGTFDLALALNGTPTREPRQAPPASNPQMVLTLPSPPTATDGAINCNQEVVITNGTCNSVAVNGNDLVVNMTYNKNACVTVTLTGLTGLTGTNKVSAVTLEGDAQGNGNVNILDLQAIKNQLNVAVTAANFKTDVNVTGNINILDLQACKNNLNHALPACP